MPHAWLLDHFGHLRSKQFVSTREEIEDHIYLLCAAGNVIVGSIWINNAESFGFSI